jgi:hypothetical protein
MRDPAGHGIKQRRTEREKRKMIKQKIAIRILLLVARMLSDEVWQQEIKDIANQISVWVKE